MLQAVGHTSKHIYIYDTDSGVLDCMTPAQVDNLGVPVDGITYTLRDTLTQHMFFLENKLLYVEPKLPRSKYTSMLSLMNDYNLGVTADKTLTYIGGLKQNTIVDLEKVCKRVLPNFLVRSGYNLTLILSYNVKMTQQDYPLGANDYSCGDIIIDMSRIKKKDVKKYMRYFSLPRHDMGHHIDFKFIGCNPNLRKRMVHFSLNYLRHIFTFRL